MLKITNILILICFPISWFAPLMHASLLPLFGMSEITIISGIKALWDSDKFLATVVVFFAIFVPIFKNLTFTLLQFGFFSSILPLVLKFISKFSMAEIFLIALYITVFKSTSFGHIEIGWGCYLFTFCVIGSIIIQSFSPKEIR